MAGQDSTLKPELQRLGRKFDSARAMIRLELNEVQCILPALEKAATEVVGLKCQPPTVWILSDNEVRLQVGL